MIGTQSNAQATLFIPGDIRDYIPDDYILARVDKILDLSWLKKTVAGKYCENNGRPSIAPEAALRLMLAGFFLEGRVVGEEGGGGGDKPSEPLIISDYADFTDY